VLLVRGEAGDSFVDLLDEISQGPVQTPSGALVDASRATYIAHPAPSATGATEALTGVVKLDAEDTAMHGVPADTAERIVPGTIVVAHGSDDLFVHMEVGMQIGATETSDFAVGLRLNTEGSGVSAYHLLD
jgi:hypothetical protein